MNVQRVDHYYDKIQDYIVYSIFPYTGWKFETGQQGITLTVMATGKQS